MLRLTAVGVGSPLGDEQRVRFVLPPRFGEADEAGGSGDTAYGCDLAVGDVERHGADDPVADHEEDGRGVVDERVVDGGVTPGKSSFRGCGLKPTRTTAAMRCAVSYRSSVSVRPAPSEIAVAIVPGSGKPSRRLGGRGRSSTAAALPGREG
ncbi:hypothetical protein [Micromonospora chersina]|uniref:hypothetical protein n=1 Tax=Micromonospora chersina TaxID=47854 RepID=UPI003D913384